MDTPQLEAMLRQVQNPNEVLTVLGEVEAGRQVRFAFPGPTSIEVFTAVRGEGKTDTAVEVRVSGQSVYVSDRLPCLLLPLAPNSLGWSPETRLSLVKKGNEELGILRNMKEGDWVRFTLQVTRSRQGGRVDTIVVEGELQWLDAGKAVLSVGEAMVYVDDYLPCLFAPTVSRPASEGGAA
jgi:hypothetical protein